MQGKIILIEGTDCSGKETQANLLLEYLNNKGIKTIKVGFPNYNCPTGKIVGGPYLGKDYICEGWFPESATKVNPKVSALYYGADFLYNLPDMKKELDKGTFIILDRYFYSTFAHQGGKEKNKKKREEIYEWFSKLFLDLLELPDPDIKLFLHMPFECGKILRAQRAEKLDQNEQDDEHLKNAEKAYLEIAKLYNFNKIECGNKNKIKNIEEIHNDLIKVIEDFL